MMKSTWIDMDVDTGGPDLELQFDNFLDDIARDADSQLCSYSDDQLLTDDGESVPSVPSTPPPATTNDSPIASSWLDSTIYLLSTDAEDAELIRAQKAYDQVVAAKESAAARALVPAIPKIMKNDIRRYFSRMFMNTINSADFRNIQSYFHTFMAGPCKFVADHELIPEFKIPGRLVAAGPTLMSHYLLGCFVQYPDMAMTMKNSSIVTSTSWAGTKIVMEMEIRSTKMYDLDFSDWIPQITDLDTKYGEALALKAATEAQAVKKRRRAASLKAAVADLSLEPVSLQSAIGSVSPGSAGGSVTCQGEGFPAPVVSATALVFTTDTAADLPDAPAVSPTAPTTVKQPVGKNAPKKTKPEGKASKSKSTAASKKRNSDDLELTSDASDLSALAPDAAPRSDEDFQIPEAYVHSLFAKARLLPKPIELVLGGTITMFLDENNHMQHMGLDMRQTNR